MIVAGVLLAAALLSGHPTSASGQPKPVPDVTTWLDGSTVGVDGKLTPADAPTPTAKTKKTKKAVLPARDKPRLRRLVPTCAGNTPQAVADALCTAAVAPCVNEDGGSYRAWLFEQTPVIVNKQPQLQWRLIRAYCVTAGESERGDTPVLSVQQFRRLPLPAGQMHIQPGSGPVLINVPTNVYVKAEPLLLRTTVVGVAVQVEATPSSFAWTFGDGGTLLTRDHGAPYPDMRTTHTYLHPGKWPVSLRTVYTGRYRRLDEPGAPWLPVGGTAEVGGPAVVLDVVEARAVLVR